MTAPPEMSAVRKTIESLPGDRPSTAAAQAAREAGEHAVPACAAPPSAMMFRNRQDSVEASEYLRAVWGVTRTPKTLAKLRCVGGGPAFRRFKQNVIYDKPALDSWALSLLSAPMSRTCGGEP